MERIKISTKEQKVTGILPINVDEKDHDISFEFTSLQEFKKAVQLSVKARDIYLKTGKTNASEDPVGMLDAFEEAAKIYRDVLRILLGEVGYTQLVSLIGGSLPSVISQALITSLGELYSKHFMRFTAEFLSTEGKL